MRRAKRRNSKKVIAAIAIVVVLALLATAGTIAWLTKTSTITNTFTVGSFTVPTTDPTDPSKTVDLEGNICEPNWDKKADHKLLPGNEYAKDPYVGIGAGSEDAVVYVKVENNIPNNAYFTLNSGWVAVDGYATAVTGDGIPANTYKSGIFKYTEELTASATADVWTESPLFSKIVTSADANADDFVPATGEPTVVVKAFLHQAKDSSGNSISASKIESTAISTLSGN